MSVPGVGEPSLAYYADPGRFTTLDDGEVPSGGIAEIVDVVQGLLVYDVVAEPFYGVELTAEQVDAIHERDSQGLLSRVRAVDDRPLTSARRPAERVGARCHAFSRLTVALLRAGGVPARARCGFGAYFNPGWYEDHWVAEYWDAAATAWRMADAQLDATWRDVIGFAGDTLDVTPTEFVTAGHAWRAWRDGQLDADRCGLSSIPEHGAHWIAHNLRLDLAALNKVEMLPWDLWGAGWEPGSEPTADLLERFDRIAELTVDPDARFDELRRCYESDESLRVGDTVFNVARGCVEPI